MRRRPDRCIRCGRPVPWETSVCRRCNPGALPSPGRTQYHATVFLAVLVPLALFAIWLMIRG